MKLPLFISNNLSLKIVSTAMAILFWLYVMAAKDTEKLFQVPVQITNLDSRLTIDAPPPVSLDVVFKGNRLSLLFMSRDSLKVILNLEGVKEGRVLFTNLENVVSTDSKVHVVRIQPSRIELNLVRKVV